MNRLWLAIGLLLWAPPALAATPVVADLSNYSISIDSSFNGTRMFVFGARNAGGDIVVVVRGPSKHYIVRKKEPIGGVWVNRERMKFYNVPDFYAVASSKPLSDMGDSPLLAQLGIGQDNLLTPPPRTLSSGNFPDFEEAFLRHQQRSRLYSMTPEPVNFMAETLFKTAIDFPDNIPPGNYTAEIYLISDGELVGMQSTPISVVKSGLDAFLFDYAHNHPVFYGLTAVLLALGVGWGAARAFEKF
ncbi:MAG: hypothetical protein EBV03_09590 [Proteobacteria bacterium]|nr:hypothetical protein [Pseudomonadota bacterium]